MDLAILANLDYHVVLAYPVETNKERGIIQQFTKLFTVVHFTVLLLLVETVVEVFKRFSRNEHSLPKS